MRQGMHRCKEYYAWFKVLLHLQLHSQSSQG